MPLSRIAKVLRYQAILTFFILSPNTGLGHNSVLHMKESQINYVMEYIHYLEKSGDDSYLDVKEEEQQDRAR